MKTVRRIYLYIVAFISLEVVVWGLIGLIRSALDRGSIGNEVGDLARALSLIFVGVPVFLLHWGIAQGAARRDNDEKLSRTRALFIYGVLISSIIPITQNLLAIIDRSLFAIFQAESAKAEMLFGGNQVWTDNLIAIVMNSILAIYMIFVLRSHRDDVFKTSGFSETRRLYRYLWVLYGLILSASGFQQIIQFLLELGESIGNRGQGIFVNGLAMALVGIPIWIYSSRVVTQALTEEMERNSILRMVFIYSLSLIGMIGVLTSLGFILYEVFQIILGNQFRLTEFFSSLSEPLSSGLSMGMIWIYHGRLLKNELNLIPSSPRRSALRRIYLYISSLIGLGLTFIGLRLLLTFILDSTLLTPGLISAVLRDSLSSAISILVIGIPLWIISWLPTQKEAALLDEEGDHARRSVIRKSYLYLILFICVIGLMVSMGVLVFNLIQALLGSPPLDFGYTILNTIEMIVLFGFFLYYHWREIRSDNIISSDALASHHTNYPILVLVGESDQFSERLVKAILREAPTMPVAIHLIKDGVPNPMLSQAAAVVLTGAFFADPPEATRLWLKSYEGEKLIVPLTKKGWVWVFSTGRSLESLVNQTAKIVRHLAEGEDLPENKESSISQIILYIVLAIIGLPIVGSIIGIVIDILQ